MLRSVVASVSCLTLIGISAVTMSMPLAAVAGDTEVQTVLCDGTASATLTIDAPLSDTVVTAMPLTITGSVSNVTQINITVDSSYAGTVPLSANQTIYSTQLTIDQGTHTIELTGNDVCQVQNPTDNIVVTFEPPTSTPGNTGGSPVIGPSTNAGFGSVTGEMINNQNDQGLAALPVIGDVVAIARKIANALDFDSTARDGGLYVTIARFALFTTGLGLTLFGASILYATRKWRQSDISVREYITGKKALLGDPKLREHIDRNIFIVRGVGIILISMAFLI